MNDEHLMRQVRAGYKRQGYIFTILTVLSSSTIIIKKKNKSMSLFYLHSDTFPTSATVLSQI